MSVDDATRARAAMRLYGRQSRVRARRRRVAHELSASSLALLAIPVGASPARSAAPSCTACASRASRSAAPRAREAEREISAAVGDELQREVTVTVAGRSATLSPYDLGVRVDAPAPRARRSTPAACAAACSSRSAYSRSIDPVLRYPDNLALPARARGRDAVAGRRAPGAQAERRRHRSPRQARRRLRSRRGAARDHARAALADRGQVSLRTVPDARRDPDRGRAPRQAARRPAAVGADHVHAARPGSAASWPVRRLAPLLTATTYKHVIGVKFDPIKVGAALRPPLSDYLRPAKDARWKVAG